MARPSDGPAEPRPNPHFWNVPRRVATAVSTRYLITMLRVPTSRAICSVAGCCAFGSGYRHGDGGAVVVLCAAHTVGLRYCPQCLRLASAGPPFCASCFTELASAAEPFAPVDPGDGELGGEGDC